MSLVDVHELTNKIVVVLPLLEDSQIAMRHIHTIDVRGHQFTMVIPARKFDSSTFIPFLCIYTHSTVDDACNVLCIKSGAAVPGRQKYHICTLITNRRASILPETQKCAATSRADAVAFVDLLFAVPTKTIGHFAKALVDTAANHNMITRTVLSKHNIAYTL